MDGATIKAVALAGAVGVVGLLAWKLATAGSAAVAATADAAGGLLTGNNALTEGATNAAGDPVSAYEGAGVLGTLGAGVNAVSGGVYASIGEWLGGRVYDWTHGDVAAATVPVKGGATSAPAEDGGWTWAGLGWGS